MKDPLPDDPQFVIGVDLGGTKIRAGIANSNGTILADRTVATRERGEHVQDQIVTLVELLSQDSGVSPRQITATGIGGAGVPNTNQGGFTHAPNLSMMDKATFSGSLSEALGHRVVIENDVNVAALGELHYGIGRECRDFVCISIGTGIGMGIVINGQLLRGSHGAAGEIGYLPMGTDPLDPVNHRRGPLEEVLAGDRLAQRYAEATGRIATAEAVFGHALFDDVAAVAAIEVEAKWLAHAIVAVNAVLDTEVVVLTGGIGGRPELLGRTTSWLKLLGVTALPVIQSSLGPDAPIAGAVRLALDATTPKPKGSAR